MSKRTLRYAVYTPQTADDKPVNERHCRAKLAYSIVEENRQCSRLPRKNVIIDGRVYGVCDQHAAIYLTRQKEVDK